MLLNNWKTYPKTRLSIHDPAVIQVEETVYVFGTHLTAAKSNDLINWQVAHRTEYEAMEENYLLGNVVENLASSLMWAGYDDADTEGGYGLWAPDIIWNPYYRNQDGSEGAYLYFYSTSSTWRRSAIGFAVAPNIENAFIYGDTIVYSGFTKVDATDKSERNINYRYTHLQHLIDSGQVASFSENWVKDAGMTYNSDYAPNAIDPSVFFDEEGLLWMVYGSWSGGIFILELDIHTALPKYPGIDSLTSDGQVIDRYFGKKLVGGYHQSGEGPYIIYNKSYDYYYLYMTYGELRRDGAYNMRVFRSRKPDGPYYDMLGQQAIYQPADRNEDYGLKLMGNYQLTEIKPGYKSPGHNSFIHFKEKDFILFHTRFDREDEQHELRIHQVLMTADGWPVVLPFEYLGDIEQTFLSIGELVGRYEWLNHGTLNEDEVKITQVIYLHENGQITGHKDGSWSRNTENELQIQLDGIEFSCRIYLQKVIGHSKGRLVIAGTGQNMTVWGIKQDV